MAIQIRPAVRPFSVTSIRKLAYSIATLAVSVAIGVVALAQAPGTWTPRASMSNPRQFPVAGVIDGKLYVAGGNDNRWHNPDGSVAPGPGAGIVLRVPGMEIYDPTLDTWSPGISMPTPLYAAASGGIGDRLYVAGGQAWPTVEPGINMARVQIFDTTTNTWSFGTPMPQAVGGMSSAVFDGKLYVAGGRSSGNTVNIGNLYIYDPVREHDGNPATNPWSSAASMTPRQFAAATFFQGQMFVLGGEAGGALTTVQAYNPATDIWVTKAPLLTARYGLTAAVVDGWLYAIGGVNPSTHLHVVEVYDPAAGPAGADGRPIGAWSIAGPLPTPQTTPASAVIDGVLFLAGGMVDGTTFTGLTRAFSTLLDTDSDGLDDSIDPDDDGDGQSDADETACGSNPLSAASVSTDTDADRLPNCVDADDDGDGVSDGGDIFPLNAAESLDFDGDGLGNNGDPDDDNDGIPDASDVFPFDALNVHPIFIVNSTADAVDALPGNAVCATATGSCTLRAAVQESNALAGADIIHFSSGVNGSPITLTLVGEGENGAATGDLDTTGMLTVTGNGAANTVIQACDGTANPACVGLDRLFEVIDASTLTLTGVTLRKGNAEGGAVSVGQRLPWAGSPGRATLNLNSSDLRANRSGSYGGAINTIWGIVAISDSIVDGNQAVSGGGGVHNAMGTITVVRSTFSGNAATGAGAGGAIFNNSGSAVGDVTISDSTFHGNTAHTGGALFNNAYANAGTYRVSNSTFSANTAVDRGGAIFNANGPVYLASVTLSGNHAAIGGGLVTDLNNYSSSAHIFARNTIIANSTGGNCAFYPTIGPATLMSQGYNLADDASCNLTATGDRPSATDGLVPLAANGGATLTHGLLGTSAAIDAGDPAGCTSTTGVALTTDQRGAGFVRALDGNGDGTARCDIGALEGIGITADTDGDGVLDVSDALPLNPAESVDSDGDGLGNQADLDDDGDGVADVTDPFPLDPARSKADQTVTFHQFIATGSMATVRESFAIAALSDGALVAGGYPFIAAAERYHSASGTFAPAGSLPSPRAPGDAVAVLLDGRVLLAGGSDGSALDTAVLYDSSTGFVSTGRMGAARFLHTVTRMLDGRVLVTGGVGGPSGPYWRSAEVYDPATGQFSYIGDMAVARAGHTATLLADGRVLVAGGHFNGVAVATAEIFNPATGEFSPAGSTSRWYHAATLLPDGKVLVVGGYNGAVLTSAQVYDPALNAFTSVGSLHVPRQSPTATRLPGGKVLIAGGSSTSPSAELYHSGQFFLMNNMTEPRQQHGAVLLGTGNVLLAGGFKSPAGYTVLATAELYIPTDRTLGDPDFPLRATATSGLPVTFSATGQCTVTGNMLHLIGLGDCTVTASQEGNASYNAASTSVTYTVNDVDTDSDGIGDSVDSDDDGDGVADGADSFPLDRTESVDTDGDGIGNNADDDDDNDGFFDIIDGCPLVPGPANGCSPTEAVSNLEGNITALDLSANSEGLLTNTLSNVDRALDSGNTAAARAQLRAFVNQVQSLQRRGQLSEAAAAALIANADGIVAGL